MNVALARMAASIGALVSVVFAVSLMWGLANAPGARSWDRPVLAIIGGLVLATAVAMVIGLAAKSWRRRSMRPTPALVVAALLLAAGALGGFLVLRSTSTAHTLIAEIVE